jgi:hypothetical protein
MEFNDEKLSINAFEKMAKEYSTNMKNRLKVFEYKEDDEIKEQNIKKINTYKNNIFNNLTMLKCYKKNNKIIENLFLEFEIYAKNIEKIATKNNEKYFKTNYCNNIFEIIQNTTQSIKTLVVLQEYKVPINIPNAILSLVDIIEKANSLYGICRFRQ